MDVMACPWLGRHHHHERIRSRDMVDQLRASVGSEARQRYLRLLTLFVASLTISLHYLSLALKIFLSFFFSFRSFVSGYGVKTPAPSTAFASLLVRIAAPFFEQCNSSFESRRAISV